MISSCNWPIPTFTSQHSRPLNTNGLCSVRSKVASHWHYYFDTFKLGRPSGKWKFASVFIFMLLVWQIMYSFAEMHWHSSMHTFDGEFSETETQRDIFSLCISSRVLFWCNLTKIFCWGNSRIFQRKPEKLIFPLSEKSSSWEQEPHKFKLKSMLLFLTKRRGKHWVDWHCCKLYLNV